MTDPMFAKYAFNHAQFQNVHRGVRFFSAKRVTVLVGAGDPPTFSKICQITFHRGAVFAQFTYFGESHGLVAALHPVQQADGSWKMDLGANGIVAPNVVKYSHPPDGLAHFSQDGKVLTSVRRQSFPLTTGSGHLFEMAAFNPTRFEPLVRGTEKVNRLYAPFYFTDRVPDGIGLTAMWWPFNRLVQMKPSDRILGPLESMINHRTNRTFKAFYVCPPEPVPPSHVLLVNVGPISVPSGVTEPLLTFLGGWDHDVESKTDPGGCLTFMYPLEDPAGWEGRRGSIAFVPGTIPETPG